MEKDLSELIEYLDKKFSGVDKHFEEVDEKFDRLFDVFATKEDLQEVKKEMATKDNANQLLTSVDAYAHKADAFFQEMVALSHQYNRHEKWIQMLAEKLGVKLEY
ncbi:MAG: hypothetical protein PHW31_01635 [Candidatus Pacebacteria bacterium]|nr:hypothetical protein [Candidatus Paceibacterota bacterium]